MPIPVDLDRRAFLKLGVAGGVTLAAAGLGATLTGCARPDEPAAEGYRFLRHSDLKLLAALTPVVLADLPLDDATAAGVLLNADGQFVRVAPAAQANLRSLLDLLHFGPSRWLTTGVRVPWEEADARQIEAFLQRWRASSVSLFTSGYAVLVQTIALGYFAQPLGQQAAGYRPLPHVFAAVNG
jgi:hypothetical protein